MSISKHFFIAATLLASALLFLLPGCTDAPDVHEKHVEDQKIRLITLNPGHFHAALIQRDPLPDVHPEVHIYAPEGPDLELHLERIERFNTRTELPASWESIVYTGDDYLQEMLHQRAGDVVVTAGNNALKTDYILASVKSGMHVLSDKPMAINREEWKKLARAFERADENDVLLYDIMTERSELASRLLRALSADEKLFGSIPVGTPDEPALQLESVHHLFKYVSGAPLRRPTWYFDVHSQGEGIVDVTTHLVDLSMWLLFPDQALYVDDAELVSARRSPTMVTSDQFSRITSEPDFPEFLSDQLNEEGVLPLYCNGNITYRLNGHHVHVSVIWDYEAPEGGDDTHHTTFRGSQSTLFIRQGPDQDFISTVYIRPNNTIPAEEFEL
ncbi:putative oxidoreductase C-terminal domain-containing protein, partial [Balneolaceae bacterium ANBcel3]|nr:putative oxidoreductase C-terminal domain-containing protein [Balneolaceae bacterium ANBcel3]